MGAGVAVSPAETVTLPTRLADADTADSADQAEYQRTFNRPTGLDQATDVSLVLEHIRGRDVLVALNGDSLDNPDFVDGELRYVIRHRLQPQNSLVIRLSSTPANSGTAGILGEVRLEIR